MVLCLLSIFISGSLSALSVESGFKVDRRPGVTAPGTPVAATPCVGGMAGAYPCDKIDLLAFVPIASMGCTSSGNTVEGWTDPLSGKEYALMGCDNGVSFLDVSDPVNPVWLGRLPGHNGTTSLWRDIRVFSNRAYVGSEASGHGIQVFNLTRLRGVTTPQTFTEDAHYSGLGNSHTIYINQSTGFLYAVGSGGGGNVCTSGLHMINVQNPTPVYAGCFNNGVYTHETTCLNYSGPDTTYAGHELCFAANGPTQRLVIVDVTNKPAPVQLSSTTYTGSSYPHQVWLTEDQTYLLLDDELDESSFGHNTETYIWNISDLNNPQLVNAYQHATSSIDHNLYVKGNYVYESNYQAGLRILDLSNVGSGTLNEVGYFDIWPYGDSADFEGTWDNYPYLPSGIVLVSGIFNPDPPNPPNVAGLFILQPHITPDFSISPQSSTLNACVSGGAQGSIQLVALNGYAGNVTLNASGLPGGASADFAPNPAAIPGSTSINISLTGTPGGNYPFNVNATDGTISHDQPMTLNVASGVPPSPTLLNPVNNGVDVPFVVHYEWDPVAGASSYDLEISTAQDFSTILYSANVQEDHHTATLTLDALTTYYWRVRAYNACGVGTDSLTFQFTTMAPAQILIVDDDDNNPDTLAYYGDAITSMGKAYNVWDTLTQSITHSPRHLDEPDSTILSQYAMVIWISGDAMGGPLSPVAGPSESSETSLSIYLNNGGCLFLSSQQYFFDRGSVLNPFMTNYLGVGSEINNVVQTNVTGTGIFSGVGNFPLNFPSGFLNRTDRVVPAAGAQSAFSGSNGNAAVSKDAGTYHTIYLGFPLEAIANASARKDVLQRAFDFCTSTPPPPACLFCDDFNDGVQPGWVFGKGTWQEGSGALSGSYSRKSSAVASPVFAGCSTCTVEAKLQTSGGAGNRVSLLAWHVDKHTGVELIMNEESDRWLFKQRIGGTVTAKAKAAATIVPGVNYDARITFDGSVFQVFIDNALVMTVPATGSPSGTVGFQVKGTTGAFDEIQVN